MPKIKIFVSYSHEDEVWVSSSIPGANKLIPWLEKQLRNTAEIWTDHALKELPGERYSKLINEKILDADIALLLISQDFVSSEFIMEKELPLIKQQYDDEKIKIIPLLITNVSTDGKEKIAWIFDLQTYPNDTKPLISFLKDAAAWSEVRVEILNGINNKINSIKKQVNPSHAQVIVEDSTNIDEKIVFQKNDIIDYKESNGEKNEEKILLTSEQIKIENNEELKNETDKTIGKDIIDTSVTSHKPQIKKFNTTKLKKKGIILGASIVLMVSFCLFLLFYVLPEIKNSKLANEAISAGISNEKNGEYKKAIEAFKKAVSIKPNCAEAYYYLGITFNNNDENDSAITAFLNAISFKAEYAEAHNWLGLSYANKGKNEIAKVQYKMALSINPDFFEALGNLYKIDYKYDSAIIFYNKAISIRPDCAEIYNWMGNSYSSMDKEDEAISAYQKAITIKPGYVKVYRNIGQSYFYKKDYERAIDAFKKSISIKSDDEYAYYLMAISYYYKKEFDTAISTYQKAISIKTDYYRAYYGIGDSYYSKKEYGRAINAYQKAILIKPDFTEAYYWMGLSYYCKKEYNYAIEAFQKVLSIKSDYASAYYWVGSAYYYKKDNKMQKEFYKKGAKLGDKNCQEYLKKINETW
jgi:tetratricopeptide (TPR) repeat protein